MRKAFLHRAAGLLPPPLRRAASGLWLDMKSLPARAGDPARRAEPWAVLHNVGEGDFRVIGEAILRDLIDYGGLQPSDRVLDIGCGTGRVAARLAEYLSPEGAYLGFDVSARAIRACRRRFAEARPVFRFVHADVGNRDYNARGRTEAAHYGFPCGDGEIDFAFATSVFTHMRLDGIGRYLCETARVLAPGGRFLFTAYALTPERRAAVVRGEARMPLHDWRDGSMVMDPRSPERAIAHDEAALLAAVEAASLELARPWLAGEWCSPAAYGGWQDLFIAAKPDG